jgi:hypothetical protein
MIYKQIAASVLINPNIGQTNINSNFIIGLTLSNKRCKLVAHEIINLLYATNAGVQLFEIGYLGINLIRSNSERINNAVNYGFTGGALNISNIQTIFVYNDNIFDCGGPKAIELEVLPSQVITISYAVYLKNAPTVNDNSLQFTYRLFWEELE